MSKSESVFTKKENSWRAMWVALAIPAALGLVGLAVVGWSVLELSKREGALREDVGRIDTELKKSSALLETLGENIERKQGALTALDGDIKNRQDQLKTTSSEYAKLKDALDEFKKNLTGMDEDKVRKVLAEIEKDPTAANILIGVNDLRTKTDGLKTDLRTALVIATEGISSARQAVWKNPNASPPEDDSFFTRYATRLATFHAKLATQIKP